jgi:hypothetical protein
MKNTARTVDQTGNDVPQRTWRGWWRDQPGWFRIGCRTVFASIVVQVAFAIRIAVGLIDPHEVALLRQKGANVLYTSDAMWDPIPGALLIRAGLWGRSCNDVYFIRLDEHGTDEDLKLIGARFPNLKCIYLRSATISEEGLNALTSCRKLQQLELDCTDVDDVVVECLTRFEAISSLSVEGTLVSDAAIPTLKKIPHLGRINVSKTDVSLAAIQEWRTSQPKLVIQTERDRIPDALVASIRWSDGKRSRRFQGHFKSGIPSVGKTHAWLMSKGLHARHHVGLWWDPAQLDDRRDGDYVFTLQLGDYEAEPVTIPMKDGKFAVDSFEFRMPVTEAEALQSIPPEYRKSTEDGQSPHRGG